MKNIIKNSFTGGIQLFLLFFFIPFLSYAQEGNNKNEKIITDFFEQVWDQGNLEFIEQVTTPEFIIHYQGKADTASYEEHKAVVKYWRQAIPDYSITIQDVLSDKNKVIARFSFTGTHKDTLMGIPPTWNTIRSTGIWICNVENKLLQECWEEYDIQSILSQLQSAESSK